MLGKLEWWGMIKDYNTTVFPLQFIVMAVGIVLAAIYLLDKKGRANLPLKIYFAICNLWIGIMFFWILGAELPAPARQIQGGLFVAIGILFAVDIFAKKIDFTVPESKNKRIITTILLAAVMMYPLVGLLAGRGGYDSIIYVGALPCATTAFALVMMIASMPRTNKVLYILLMIWAIPFPPLVQIPKYQVYEDGIMFLIGVLALACFIVNLVKQNKDKKITKDSKSQ